MTDFLTNLNLLLLLLLIFCVSNKSQVVHTHGGYSSELMLFFYVLNHKLPEIHVKSKGKSKDS